ncbi:hypothetical protein JW851_01980 [Candidatus Woesearchaeota archaeon]|nr:hypothetical protein [Candidatus Woesearchaeota archaeon]
MGKIKRKTSHTFRRKKIPQSHHRLDHAKMSKQEVIFLVCRVALDYSTLQGEAAIRASEHLPVYHIWEKIFYHSRPVEDMGIVYDQKIQRRFIFPAHAKDGQIIIEKEPTISVLIDGNEIKETVEFNPKEKNALEIMVNEVSRRLLTSNTNFVERELTNRAKTMLKQNFSQELIYELNKKYLYLEKLSIRLPIFV